MHKSSKQTVAELEYTKISSTVSDMVFTTDGGVTKWQAIYTILEDEEPEVVEVKATADDARPSNL